MIRNKMSGRVLQVLGALQTVWGIIVLDELHEVQGIKNRMIGSLQGQYGCDYGQAENDVELLMRRFPHIHDCQNNLSS